MLFLHSLHRCAKIPTFGLACPCAGFGRSFLPDVWLHSWLNTHYIVSSGTTVTAVWPTSHTRRAGWAATEPTPIAPSASRRRARPRRTWPSPRTCLPRAPSTHSCKVGTNSLISTGIRLFGSRSSVAAFPVLFKYFRHLLKNATGVDFAVRSGFWSHSNYTTLALVMIFRLVPFEISLPGVIIPFIGDSSIDLKK